MDDGQIVQQEIKPTVKIGWNVHVGDDRVDEGKDEKEVPEWALHDLDPVDDPVLPLHIYQTYLDAITMDNSSFIDMALTVASSGHRKKLLNAKFDYEDDHLSRYNTYKFMRVRRPICLAVISASVNVVDVFIKHGIDINGRDCMQNNFVHMLISMSFHKRHYEKQFTSTYKYIIGTLSIKDRTLVLRTENSGGYRPLEFAAHHGTLFLVEAIMNTEGVYLSRVEKKGLCRYSWYDVTAYESLSEGNRRHMSPVIALMMLDVKNLDHANVNKVFFKEPMCAWIEAKLDMNKPLIFLWLMLRLCHMVTFFLLDISISLNEQTPPTIGNGSTQSPMYQYTTEAGTDTTTGTGQQHKFCRFDNHGIQFSAFTKNALRGYVLVHCVLILLMDIVDHFRHISANCVRSQITIDGKQKIIVSHNQFYEHVYRWFVVSILVDSVLKLNGISTGTYANFVRLMSMVLAPWPLLFFIQVLPSIGYFVTAIQRMLRQLYDFGCVYALFMLVFTHGFYVIVNSSRRASCEQTDFKNLYRSFYTTFNMMLNMVDVHSFHLVEPTSFYLLHVVYIFLVGILLINFLIAIMSSAMANVAEHKPMILVIQRLSVSYALERRVWSVLKKYYYYMNRKKFVYSKDGRIHLVRAAPICNASCSM